MKILLLQPPIQDFYDTDIRLQPIGLCMLKAALLRSLPELEVRVRDYHRGWGRRTIPLPEELAYLGEYYPWPDQSPFCGFHHYYHFGAEFEALGRDVARQKPDLVGISSLFSPYHREVLSCAREIKLRLDVPIVVGGAHASAAPQSMLAAPQVDYVIVGEGEKALVELVSALRTGGPLERVSSLGFKRDGRALLNPVRDNFAFESLPPPDFSDLPPDRYTYRGRPLCFVNTSRGCPHHCSFCAVHTTFGSGFRRRPVESVVEEIGERYRQGYRVFDFEDDNLAFDRQAFAKLLRRVAAGFGAEKVTLAAMNGISYAELDGEILGLMKQAGFEHLDISLVSGRAGSRRRIGRPHTLDQFLRTVNAACGLGFRTVAYQILGLPHETLADMTSTLALTAAQPVLIGASIFYLTPGCPMASEFPAPDGTDLFRARSTAMAIEASDFTREDLYTLFMTARIVNFLKGLPLGAPAVSLKDALVSAAGLGKRAGLGARILEKLLIEKRLCAATDDGLKPLARFRAALFFEVLRKARLISGPGGALIELPTDFN